MLKSALLASTALLLTLGVSQAQTHVPADVGTLPTTTPQEFDLQDKTGTWVPFGTVDPVAHAFSAPAYVGTGETWPITPQDRAVIRVSARDWGTICDGGSHPLSATYATLAAAQVLFPAATSLDEETDNAAIQGAWNFAASRNSDLYIGGVAKPCVGINLFMPAPTNGSLGNRSALYGDGQMNTVLQAASGTGAGNCAINITASLNVNSLVGNNFRNFRLQGPDAGAGHGYGICVTGVNGVAVSYVWLDSLSYGVYGVNSQYVTLDHLVFNIMGNYGLRAQCGSGGTVTCPDGWHLIAPRVAFNDIYGFVFDSASETLIEGGVYQGNQQHGSATAVITMNGNPVDGVHGLTLIGGYFSGNAGLADVAIKPYPGYGPTNLNGSHAIIGAEFQRAGTTVFDTNNVTLQNGGSTGMTTVSISASSFQGFGAYVPTAARPYIGVTSPATANFTFAGSIGNWFAPTADSPLVIGSPWWPTYNPATFPHNVPLIITQSQSPFTWTPPVGLASADFYLWGPGGGGGGGPWQVAGAACSGGGGGAAGAKSVYIGVSAADIGTGAATVTVSPGGAGAAGGASSGTAGASAATTNNTRVTFASGLTLHAYLGGGGGGGQLAGISYGGGAGSGFGAGSSATASAAGAGTGASAAGGAGGAGVSAVATLAFGVGGGGAGGANGGNGGQGGASSNGSSGGGAGGGVSAANVAAVGNIGGYYDGGVNSAASAVCGPGNAGQGSLDGTTGDVRSAFNYSAGGGSGGGACTTAPGGVGGAGGNPGAGGGGGGCGQGFAGGAGGKGGNGLVIIIPR